MNILKAIHELQDTRSVSIEYGVLTRYDSLERYRFEQPSMLVGMELQKIAKFILERKPEPAYYALVRNRLFEYIFNHKEVPK